MLKVHSFPQAGFFRIVLLALLLAAGTGLLTAKENWDPVAPADLAATECKAYPGADAEVLFERLVLSRADKGQLERHYIRYKLYTTKGIEDSGNYDIEYDSSKSVSNLIARVIKPDGSSQEYGWKDFTESVAVKYAGAKIKKLSIALPNLSAGDIVEMQWGQTTSAVTNSMVWWYCQRTLPVREFVFLVESSAEDFSMQLFNVADAKLDQINRKVSRLTCRNLPPFEAEPNMPPMRDVRGWFMILYTDEFMRNYDKDGEFWKLFSSWWEEHFRLETKPNGAIKAKAVELTAGLATDDEKLAALYRFCQNHVTNIDYFDSARLQEAMKKLERNEGDQSPAKTLALGTGTSIHVNELFAALARGVGYKARLVFTASRATTLEVRHRNGYKFLNSRIVVIEAGNTKRYYAPGDYYVPAGMIHADNEAAPGLHCDADKVLFELNPVAKATQSPLARKGRFTLDAEGNLEGEVEVSYAGHAGIRRKTDWAGKSTAEIEADYRNEITQRLSAAEITDLAWENLKGNGLPVIVRYKLKVPAYADLAGDKIIIVPGVFEHGAAAVFSAEKRQFNVHFPYTYTQSDDIEIVLPEGYALDAGSA
jgi:hypothetical protein